jgi:16S rRNA (cytosine1402-N4)-methyltransferase
MLPSVLQPNETEHVPVLAEEVRRLLAVRPNETVVDATFGAGGHAAILAEGLRGNGKLIAVDRDPSVRPYFERFRRRAGVQARLLRGDFSVVLRQLADNGVRADAILLDLGVSSMQIDRPERGFSYAADAPLDMRMDPSAELSARELVNESPERELEQIFRRYGEERYAKQIARAIGRRRREQPFERTLELVETIRAAIPAPARFGEGHPAKRVFQALRIAVNDELGALESALPSATAMLRPGGRLAVISFHSLEDRLVKRFMRDRERGCTCPPDFPICVCGKEPELRSLSKRAVRPSSEEIAHNPRAASARLRAAVKAGAWRAGRQLRRLKHRRSRGRGRDRGLAARRRHPGAGWREASSGSACSRCCSSASSR